MSWERQRGYSEGESKDGCAAILLVTLIGIGVAAYLDSRGRQSIELEVVSRAQADATNAPRQAGIIQGEKIANIIERLREQGYDCVLIDGRNINNFFRAVKAAGDPNKWEDPPYYHIPGPNSPWGKAEFIQDWNERARTDPGDYGCADP